MGVLLGGEIWGFLEGVDGYRGLIGGTIHGVAGRCLYAGLVFGGIWGAVGRGMGVLLRWKGGQIRCLSLAGCFSLRIFPYLCIHVRF